MTSTFEDTGEDIATLVLRLLGEFANLQNWVDNVVAGIFFRQRMPNSAELVWERAISRINDKERIKLFRAIAEDLETDAELDCVNDVFMRVKHLRDKIAHWPRATDLGDGRLAISTTMISSLSEPIQDAVELDRQTVLNAIRDCKWLEAQMAYVMLSKWPIPGNYPGAKPPVHPKPARTPEQWDGRSAV